MFFDTTYQVLRVLILGACAYLVLLVVLRLSGKRTLAKLNAFDLVVTVALGSALATTLLSSDVALVEGAAAFAVLITAQYAIAWTSVRSRLIRRAVKAEPSLLLLHGTLLEHDIAASRMTAEEVLQAVRATGFGSLSDVGAVVLETDGSLSVIGAGKLGDRSALDNVRRPEVDDQRTDPTGDVT